MDYAQIYVYVIKLIFSLIQHRNQITNVRLHIHSQQLALVKALSSALEADSASRFKVFPSVHKCVCSSAV